MSNFSEPIYDVDTLDAIETRQTCELVDALAGSITRLSNIAAALREEVNTLTQKLDPHAPPAYYEIYSDLCMSFEDFSAYPRFEKQLSRFINE